MFIILSETYFLTLKPPNIYSKPWADIRSYKHFYGLINGRAYIRTTFDVSNNIDRICKLYCEQK